jgi:hypothetical protein
VLGSVFNQAIKSQHYQRKTLDTVQQAGIAHVRQTGNTILTLDEVKCLRNTPCTFSEEGGVSIQLLQRLAFQ